MHMPKQVLQSRICQATSCSSSSPKKTVPPPPPESPPQCMSLARAEYFIYRENEPHDTQFREPVFVGVAGGTACGKTSVCRKIIQQLLNMNLGEHSGILSLSQDCFYRNLTSHEQEDIQNYNFDHPEAFNFEEIIQTLRRLKLGDPVEIPQYDFVSSARQREKTLVRQAEVVLFDGILTFYNEKVRDMFDMKIFVDIDADIRLARRLRRDIVERGRDALQVLHQYEKTVKPSFESYILPTKKYADVIIPRGAENNVAIDLVCQHLQMKIMQKQLQENKIKLTAYQAA